LWYGHREFSYESTGEKNLKIGQHLPSYYQTPRGILIFRHSVHDVSKNVAHLKLLGIFSLWLSLFA